MYKQDLALNSLLWLICHKNQPNQTIMDMAPSRLKYMKSVTSYSLDWFLCLMAYQPL